MQAGRDRGFELYGRARECELLDRLLGAVRTGESRVLVVCGEAGIGKPALLDYLAGRASGCRVLRASGAESEMELAFAGVRQLCAPMVDRLDRLPGPQRDALGTAFGLSAGTPPARFLVGLAVLSLLSDVAAEQPLLCLIDDGQWLDRVSAQTLAFVARRLMAERVAMVFALRDASGQPNRGARVRMVSEEEAVEITQVRAALEGVAARFAALNATTENIEAMREVLTEMRSLLDQNDLLAYSDCNRRLHGLILA